MSAGFTENLAVACAVLGLICFIWPTLRKLKRGGAAGPATPSQALRSPLWWGGLALSVLALILLGLASNAA
jgi:hypothetical protein